MKSVIVNLLVGLSILSLFTLTSCEKDDIEKSLFEIASDDDQFSTLTDALERTGLDATLDGSGAFTVFAPTNQAFSTLLAALNLSSLDELETALGSEGLKNVLLYHVLGAKVKAADVSSGFVNTLGTRTINGQDYLSSYIDASSGVRINNATNVTATDIEGNNGVIHVIDAVLLPIDIVDLAILSPDHTTLVGALGAASGDLVNVLKGDGPFTVFAPVNQAFSDIQSVVDSLSADDLATVLTYHVVAAQVREADVAAGAVNTVAAQNITIGTTGGVTITDANGGVSNVLVTNIQGTNGVIHVIDKVLIPAL